MTGEEIDWSKVPTLTEESIGVYAGLGKEKYPTGVLKKYNNGKPHKPSR